jgi:hypothetical protein
MTIVSLICDIQVFVYPFSLVIIVIIQQFPIWLRRIAKSSGQGLDLAIQASKISTMILIQGIAGHHTALFVYPLISEEECRLSQVNFWQ